jgi:two-component system, sensor histidine kinase and response regulator
MIDTPPSILVIDDEPNNFDVIQVLLGNQGYIFHYASSGQRALDRLLGGAANREQHFQPDLILLDVMMPELDGIEVCRRIKASPHWQSVPIIMVTALSDKADLARCMATGADDFLTKPVHRVELLARVASRLRFKQQYDRLQIAKQKLVAKGDLMATMTDRIIPPVNDVLDATQRLATTALTPEQQGSVDTVLINSEILLAVVKKLVDIARSDMGDLDLKQT